MSGLSHPEIASGHDSQYSFLTGAHHSGAMRGGFRNTISLDQHIRIHDAARRVHRDDPPASQQERVAQGSFKRSVGSNGMLPYCAPQWRCGPVTRPVAPTLPMSWPRSTVSPTATSARLRW